jgi:transcriptional regulator with XRE-family HTH domain
MEGLPRPNDLLRLQRRLRGWSQDDVAAALQRLAVSWGDPEPGLDANTVSRWERGASRPRTSSVRLLCALFERPPEELGFGKEEEPEPLVPPRAAVDDDRSRRQFLERLAALLRHAAVPPGFQRAGTEPWERLLGALRQRTTVDVETVAHLERTTVGLENLEPTEVGSRALVGPVAGHLDQIIELLRGSLRPELRTRLCSIAGETAGIAGWLHWNLGDTQRAAACFESALRAAGEAGDRALGIALLGSSAACQSQGPDDLHARIAKLQGTADFRLADATPSNRLWMTAKEADAFALLGQEAECRRALDRAAALIGLVEAEGEERRPRFMALNASWLAGEHGASLAKLGRTEEARGLLLSALAGLGPGAERDRAWLTLALATTYQKDHEPEEAARVARVAFTQASKINLAPVLLLVREMVEDLKGMGATPAVSKLDQEISWT